MMSSGQVLRKRLEIVRVAAKQILVVDDEPSIREVVATCLQRLGGWEVLTASSGQEALHQARTKHPDAIILDVLMPEMDGFTFLQHLRSHPTTQSIPVVLLTGNSNLSDIELFPALGIVLAISKPFLPVALVQEIAQSLGW